MSTPGVDVVADIVAAMGTRTATFIDSKFQTLKFVREIEKNPSNLNFGYGFLVGSASPSEVQILQNYCLAINISLVLFASAVKKQGEEEIQTELLDLHAWADRAAKDYALTRLGLSTVLKIGQHSINEPVYHKDMTAVSLEVVFPIHFRQPLHT